MKRIVGVWIYLIFHLYVNAQQSLDMGLIISPSYSLVKESFSRFSKDEFISPLNYGFKVQIQENRIKWSVGLMHLTLGYKFVVKNKGVNIPGGMIEYEVTYNARGLSIPFVVDYIINSSESNRICVGVGITPVSFYSQKQYSPIENDALNMDLNILSRLYCLYNLGFSYEYYMNDRWLLSFRPNFLYQFNSNITFEFPFNNNRSYSFGFDIGISYVLNR